MKFQLFGADEATGADRTVVIEAESEESAYIVAKRDGILPYELIPVDDVQSDDAEFSNAKLTPAQRRQRERTFNVVVFGGISIALCLVATVALNSFSNKTPDEGDRRPYINSPSTSPGPILYPEGGTRDWSSVDDIETKDIAGYKIPTDPDVQRQYFKDMEEENDRVWNELVREGVVKENE